VSSLPFYAEHLSTADGLSATRAQSIFLAPASYNQKLRNRAQCFGTSLCGSMRPVRKYAISLRKHFWCLLEYPWRMRSFIKPPQVEALWAVPWPFRLLRCGTTLLAFQTLHHEYLDATILMLGVAIAFFDWSKTGVELR